jgi:hypothetical protein
MDMRQFLAMAVTLAVIAASSSAWAHPGHAPGLDDPLGLTHAVIAHGLVHGGATWLVIGAVAAAALTGLARLKSIGARRR